MDEEVHRSIAPYRAWSVDISDLSKHHETLGSIQQTVRCQLLLEIDCLASLRPEEVPEESKFLLEVDFARMVAGDVTAQHYWV